MESKDQLPEPRLTLIYRFDATLGQPLDLGETPQGHRRIVPLTGGTFTGPELRGVRHGSPEVLARLGRGEDVDASEYTFRTSTQIEASAPNLDWLTTGIFVGVGGRQANSAIYETYLVNSMSRGEVAFGYRLGVKKR